MRFSVRVPTLREHPDRWSLVLVALAVPVALAFRGELLLSVMEAGGGAFLVAFLALFLLLGAPLVAMELALGRLARDNGGASLSRGLAATRPGAGGRWAGLLVLPIAVFGLGAALYLAGASLHFAFAVTGDGPLTVLPSEVEAYWRGYTGAERNEWFDGHGASWGFWFAALGACVALLAARDGVRWAVRVGLPTALVLALLVLVRVAGLDAAVGGSDRLAGLFEPDWTALRELKTWSRAAAGVLLVAGLGLGILPALGARLGEQDDVAGRGFAIAGFVLVGLLVILVVPALLVVGQLGPDALEGGADSFMFVTVPQAWQTVRGGEGWAAAWFAASAIAFLLAAVAFAQPLVALLADHGWTRGKRTAAVAFVAFVVGQLAVFGATAGFLAEEWAVSRHWLMPLLMSAEVVYFAWLAGPRRLLEDLRVGAVVGVPAAWQWLLAVVAPLAVAAALARMANVAVDHTFALGSLAGGTATLYLSRTAMVALLVAGALMLRSPSRDRRGAA